jgi:DNA transformation protein
MTSHERPLLALPGLGPASTAMLARAGVHDAAALRARDPFVLFEQLRQSERGVSMNLLYALIGAREGIDWRVIARERRTDIANELDARRRHPRSACA